MLEVEDLVAQTERDVPAARAPLVGLYVEIVDAATELFRGGRRHEGEEEARCRHGSPLLGVVALLHGRALARILPGQAVHVGLELELARLRLAQSLADALVGDRVVFPVRDVVLLGNVTEAAAEGVELATRLHVGRRVLPDIALVLLFRALRRARPRAARRGVR